MDPLNDHRGLIDISSMHLKFDNATGSYEITLIADSSSPFIGNFRININLFNIDASDIDESSAYFSDTLNDFRLSNPINTITLSGTDSRLIDWKSSDRVASSNIPFGNPSNSKMFRSAVADLPQEGFMENEDTIAYGTSSIIGADLVPFLTVMPTSFDFGSADLEMPSASQSFTIQNISADEFFIDTASLEGAYPSEFNIQSDNCSGRTLAPGALCMIDVIFAPTSFGAKNAVLIIHNNSEFEEPPLAVEVFGNQHQAPSPPPKNGCPSNTFFCGFSEFELPLFDDSKGCFIATAAFGNPMAQEVKTLRKFRDAYLMTNGLGRTFVSLYYRYSPPVANFLRKHRWLKNVVRVLLKPVVIASSFWLESSLKQKIFSILTLLLFIMVSLFVLFKLYFIRSYSKI